MPEIHRLRRALPAAVLALLTTAGLLGASAAAAAPAGPPAPVGAAKGAPGPAPATDADAGCTLSPSLTVTSTVRSCLGVGARLSVVPALGQTATLTVTVRAGRAEKATAVTVDLPSSLAFADGTRTTAAVTGAGPSRRATLGTVDLVAGGTRTWTRTVRAVATGAGELAATATAVVDAGRSDSGSDRIHLTVGAGASKAGTADTVDHAVVPAAKAAPPVVDRPSAPLAAPSVAAAPAGKAAAPGTSCATGSWNFVDQSGVTRGVGKVQVQVLNTAGTVIAANYADGVGGYTICWGTGGATTTVAIRFKLTNNVWRIVTNANNEFFWTTGQVAVADNTTQNFGALQPANPLDHRANHLYLDGSYMFDWMYQSSGTTPSVGCWSPYAASCYQLVVHWQSDSTSGPVFSGGQVYVPAASPDSEDEPVHEYGHALMYGLYGNTLPATTNCQPHFLFGVSSATCAWVEGFADWVPTSVWGNTGYTFPSGGTTQFDTTWGDGQSTGDQVEGRVVQALDSLNDGVKYPYDNVAGPGYNRATDHFTVLRTVRPATMAGFWSGRASVGQDTSQASLSALFQGTIDYGFRNPLTDGIGKAMPRPVPDNYSFTTTRGYWSAVAVRPADGNDADLTLFADAAQTSTLGASGYGGATTDFVAVNSNTGARPLQTYYPRVTAFSGSGGYTVLGVQGFSTLSAGSTTVSTGPSLPISIRDSYQTAGTPVYYRAVPQNGQSVALAYLPADGTVTGRSAAVVSATGAAGQEVTLTTTPATTGYAGLVLLDQGMTAGSVALYADSTAPTGAVTIAGGAAQSRTTTVALTLAATDAETGVDAMQISTDGTFDTESVVPFASSATATLAGANGVKTVWARFRDNAGIWSAPVSDTVKLAAAPGLTSASPAKGALAGGYTTTLTGIRFKGATAVSFGGVAGTNVTVVSDKKLTVQVPARSAAGAVAVTVTGPNGTSTEAVSFTYVAPPTITGVTPATGPVAGGQTVTVTGKGFTAATAVRFGTTAATSYQVVSSTTITAVTPARAAGKVDVRVTTSYGTSAVVTADGYTFS